MALIHPLSYYPPAEEKLPSVWSTYSFFLLFVYSLLIFLEASSQVPLPLIGSPSTSSIWLFLRRIKLSSLFGSLSTFRTSSLSRTQMSTTLRLWVSKNPYNISHFYLLLYICDLHSPCHIYYLEFYICGIVFSISLTSKHSYIVFFSLLLLKLISCACYFLISLIYQFTFLQTNYHVPCFN